MAEISLNINGKSFSIACDDGQEERVLQLGKYVDARLREIAGAGAAATESHLLVLTALVLADEAFEAREHAGHFQQQAQVAMHNQGMGEQGMSAEDEEVLVAVIDKLASRIDSVATRLEGL